MRRRASILAAAAIFGVSLLTVLSPSTALATESVTMWRLYNRWTGEHFYTASAAERDGLIAVGWTDEGKGWTAPTSGDPVYRLYNPYVAGGDHHYTMIVEERDSLKAAGWRDEGVGWCSAPASTGVPLWRQYNPYATTGTHNYTTSSQENDHLVSVGWREEGIAWYGIAEKIAGKRVVDVDQGIYQTAAITEGGELWVWGFNGNGSVGDGTRTDRHEPVRVMGDVASVSVGFDSVAALKEDGSLWTWGLSQYGELGDGTYHGHRATPVKVLDDVVSVSYGDYHATAITEDGSLWTWGSADGGALGYKVDADQTVPRRVSGITDAVSAFTGSNSTAVITSDGSLWMCGQVGPRANGAESRREEFTRILTDVASVSLGGYDHFAAIKTDGSLWMWGGNDHGQVGNGTADDQTTPVNVLNNVASVSLGAHSSAAVTKDGSLFVWGSNSDGQIGGTQEYYACPTQLMSGVSAVFLETSGYESLALKSNGSLWAWGGTPVASSPAKVLDGVTSFSSTGAITADGSLWMWGENRYGQVGDGSTTSRPAPVRVAGP